MCVDTVIVDMLAQLPAAAAAVCGAECPVIGWGGWVNARCKLQGVTVEELSYRLRSWTFGNDKYNAYA